MKKEVFITIILAAFVIINLVGAGAAASLSNSGGGAWKYQRDIIILENSGETLTDYQVLIDLKKADFPAEGKNNGEDIRFTDDNGKELDYWIESWDYAGKNAKVWVKVLNIPARGETKIIMHYGNPAGISSSSGERTFDFFDDFDDASLNTNKWLVQNGRDYEISGGKLRTGSRTVIRNTLAFSAPIIFEAKVTIPNNPTNFKTFFGAKTGNDATGLRFITERVGESTVTINNKDVFATNIAADNSEKVHTIKWRSDEAVYQRSYSTVETHTSFLPTSPLYIHFLNAPDGKTGVNIVADWARTRKYVFPEPVVVSGLYVRKSASPYSIRQFKETIITVSLKNYGETDVKDVELKDSIHPKFEMIRGDFPDPKKYDVIRPGDSREIQYTIKAKESGNYNLDAAKVTYEDGDGNIQEITSSPISVSVYPSSGSIDPKGTSPVNASVSLTGEKTDVTMNEDILLKLSAINLITKPKMHVQVIIKVPSGMSVTSSEFSMSGTNQFTAYYELEPGDGKDVEVRIRPNQLGDFNVNGRVVYYFGDEKDRAEDHTLDLPINVRKEISPLPAGSPNEMAAKVPGFEGGLVIIGILFMAIYTRKRV